MSTVPAASAEVNPQSYLQRYKDINPGDGLGLTLADALTWIEGRNNSKAYIFVGSSNQNVPGVVKQILNCLEQWPDEVAKQSLNDVRYLGDHLQEVYNYFIKRKNVKEPTVFRTRTKQLIDEYLRWLENPAAYLPPAARTARAPAKNRKIDPKKDWKLVSEEEPKVDLVKIALPGNRFFTYVNPLPENFKASDVERIRIVLLMGLEEYEVYPAQSAPELVCPSRTPPPKREAVKINGTI